MSAQKVFFNSNIRFLRERKKLTQDAISNLLNFKRSKLAAIESGATKLPPAEDLILFSTYYKISIDSLLKVDLSTLTELQLRELEAGNDIFMRGTHIRVIAISVDKDNKENLEYVPVKAKAGYLSGYHDPAYIAGLPKFSLPNLPADKSYRMFPISGDSMLPIASGSEIIGQYVEDWKNLKKQTPCIMILNGQQDFVFKLVTPESGHFLLESLNTRYAPYTVAVSEVLEIWQFSSYHCHQMPDLSGDLQKYCPYRKRYTGRDTGIEEQIMQQKLFDDTDQLLLPQDLIAYTPAFLPAQQAHSLLQLLLYNRSLGTA